METRKFEAGDYKLKKYKLGNHFHIDFSFKNERFMGLIHTDEEIINKDFDYAVRCLE